MQLLVGIGNPWPVPKASRHNFGALVLESLAAKLELEWEWHWGCFSWIAQSDEGDSESLGLVLPATPYNLSGPAVSRAIEALRVDISALTVLHDDIDLQPGCWALKSGGSDGGNKGIRSITSSLGTEQFRRLRLGIGRPEDGSRSAAAVSAHVLGAVESELQDSWDTAVDSGELMRILHLKEACRGRLPT
eukprot:TRINITY_DN108758_c0_g1_i1.p1 TRINITY_DN108758_c0_g1~~TRINITY_DN108758_c0_g1_i1.p1  ORF type:complete len:190 (+),score=34.56 TRINITY_DN108758_c0_g1_i1:128-697(+)